MVNGKNISKKKYTKGENMRVREKDMSIQLFKNIF